MPAGGGSRSLSSQLKTLNPIYGFHFTPLSLIKSPHQSKMGEMRAFSYLRWSSDIQTKGHSLERQLSITREICREHGWELDESIFPDEGLSGYHGDNLSKGHLAHFIAAVKAKKIKTPCVLVVEALDRLTRLKLSQARDLFENLLAEGVLICTANNRKIYNADSLENPFEIMMSLMEMAAAHDYSKNIARRSVVFDASQCFKTIGCSSGWKTTGRS